MTQTGAQQRTRFTAEECAALEIEDVEYPPLPPELLKLARALGRDAADADWERHHETLDKTPGSESKCAAGKDGRG